jgi:hypothetical protein
VCAVKLLHPLAERSLAENEKLWQALSAEFDAAANELRQCLRKIDGVESTADLAALERAQRRWNLVQSAMLTFLDALDDTEPTQADPAMKTQQDSTRSQ